MKRSKSVTVGLIGGVLVLLILALSSVWMGRNAKRETEEAVRSVSLLYLDELAGRREQVVAGNLERRTGDLQTALSLMSEEDLKDSAHLQAYQSRMKQLFHLEKFAFVDTDGLIYTSVGTQDNIGEYPFDLLDLSGPEIHLANLDSTEKKVVIVVPTELAYQGKTLKACFMEISMEEMLAGVSMQSQEGGATFCNIYTSDGIALSNTVLGGLAVEDNLLEALSHAVFEDGHAYSMEKVKNDFKEGTKGVVSFTYKGVSETLAYVPVSGTNWLLTYLIRESLISERISSISAEIIFRSVVQTSLAVLALLGIAVYIFAQTRKNALIEMERKSAETASRVKQEELEQRLTLQEQLLQQEKLRGQQDSMITALASDYRAVYHVDLEENDAVCYRGDPEDKEHTPEGVHFPYLERFTWYAENSVDEDYREGFLRFIDPEAIRRGLEKEQILAYRYLARRAGREYYEMIRVAGVRHAAERADHRVHAIGLGLTVIDAEMRESMAQQQALSEALDAANEANRAKTLFLSNMSHEIRTPMNAIIGLDSIALREPDLSERMRDHLEKIGGSARHLLGLINDILDMSRIESGRMTIRKEEFSFREVLEQINTMISAQCQDKGLVYDFKTAGPIRDYYIGDDMKLKQVLINILGNAVKFTPESGTVSFHVESIGQFDGQSTLRFVIRDTGIGMDKEYLPKVFDAFSQENSGTSNKYGSTGLGMAITKSIVELMNGSITVDSEKGVGTVFTVTVTLRDSARVLNPEDKRQSLQPHEMRVLVIDDDAIDCENAKAILEELGIAADTALSGKEAIELIQLKAARREAYHLIFVDYKMPEQDGVEVTRQIRKIVGTESAVVFLTGYSWDHVEAEARAAGVDSFMLKPLNGEDVMPAFHRVMDLKRNAEPEEADLTGRKILIAEDVDLNAEILEDLLELEGMESERAENGKIAVEMFQASEPGTYDAVLMDMRMPVMDGLSAAATIRKLDRPDAGSIPIIALTANAFDEDVQRSLQAGMNAHLSKPIESDRLYATLRELIGRYR